jgi:peroxiredoxin
MKRIIGFFLIILIAFNTNYAQFPDTIKIKTERVKGYGPFPRSFSFVQTLPEDNPWIKAFPKIKGIPNNLEYMMIGIEQTDFLQHTYQSYYSNKIGEELFNSCKSSWNWQPSFSEYSKEFVKLDIAVVAGYDSTGLLKIKVDKNNNYDLLDDEYFTFPEKIPGQNFWGRYTDLMPFEVRYEYYDGESIKQANVWLYLDYSPEIYNSKKDKPHPIVLAYDFAEHHSGEFYVNGKKYFASIKSDRATFRENYSIKVESDNDSSESPNLEPGISRNGLIKIEDYYYKFDKASIDGSSIILLKDSNVLEKGGNQVGLKAINFVGKSINGNEVELNKLKGKYVFLDFWGTWCAPCRDEIPKLKSVWEEFKDNNFIMIGIANDGIEDLKNFVEKNEIKWEQIAQTNDKIIISDYGVFSYPTTFLINEEGEIIAKNLRAVELRDKLSELFSK